MSSFILEDSAKWVHYPTTECYITQENVLLNISEASVSMVHIYM